MAFYKGFPGHYHPDPWSMEHRANMEAAGWTLVGDDLSWGRIGEDGLRRFMRVIAAPSDDIAAAQWFVAWAGPDAHLRLLLQDYDARQRYTYVVDLWQEGASAPSDCLPEFYASVAEAREAGWTELLRVARALQDRGEQDPAQPGGGHEFDWAHRFTIRPCPKDENGV